MSQKWVGIKHVSMQFSEWRQRLRESALSLSDRLAPRDLRRFFRVTCALAITALSFVMAATSARASLPTPQILPAKSSSSSSLSQLQLTPEEAAFVRKAKPIVVGVAGDTPPFYMIRENNRLDGLVADYLERIGDQTGLKFEPRNVASFKQTVDDANAGKNDLLPLFSIDRSRVPSFELTRVYVTIPIVYIARNGINDVTPKNNFAGYRIAVIRGTATHDYLLRTMPTAKIQDYADSFTAIRAVVENDADVYVGPQVQASYQIDRNGWTNVDLRGVLDVNFGVYRMAVSNKNPALVSIMQKAMDAISAEEDEAMRRKWTPSQTLLKPHDGQAALTETEREWVNKNRDLRVAYDREFIPFSFMGSSGSVEGLAADYLKLAEKKVGLKIASASASNWSGALEQVRSGKANLLIASARNDERRAYLNFIGPYAGVPTALITRLDDKSIVSIDDLAREKVAAIRSHFLLPELRRRYPNMKIVEVENQREALQYVDDQKVRAAIGNLNVIAPILEQHFLGALRVSNTISGGDSDLYFAVPADNPELARVLRKALDAITPQESAALRQKWLSVTYQSGVSWRQVLQIGLPILLSLIAITLITLWWNRKLKQEVTLRRAAEIRANEAAALARSMSEAKSRFLATMSHEIRGPVAGIVGTADAMMRHANSQPERDRLTVIRDSGEYLHRLLTQVLDYSKAEAGKFTPLNEPTSLSRLVQEAINPFLYVAEQKKLSVSTEVVGPLAMRHVVDPLRLRQVITNLVSNALKFTERGYITVMIVASPIADQHQPIKIRVRDTGPGIPAEAREKLFQPYQQTALGRSRADSTGLGLSICKEVIERLGGTVSLEDYVESTSSGAQQGGACFVIAMLLPVDGHVADAADEKNAGTTNTNLNINKKDSLNQLVSAQAAPSSASASLVNSKQARTERVLLVDDDPLNLALHYEVLQSEGFQVDTAVNGKEALARWQQHCHEIIFSDGAMPVMSGLEFVQQLRKLDDAAAKNKAVKKPWVVLLTSYSSELDRDEFISAGVDDFIEKPLLPRNLLEVLARRAAAKSAY